MHLTRVPAKLQPGCSWGTAMARKSCLLLCSRVGSLVPKREHAVPCTWTCTKISSRLAVLVLARGCRLESEWLRHGAPSRGRLRYLLPQQKQCVDSGTCRCSHPLYYVFSDRRFNLLPNTPAPGAYHRQRWRHARRPWGKRLPVLRPETRCSLALPRGVR